MNHADGTATRTRRLPCASRRFPGKTEFELPGTVRGNFLRAVLLLWGAAFRCPLTVNERIVNPSLLVRIQVPEPWSCRGAGRPRHPVKVKIACSNPVRAAQGRLIQRKNTTPTRRRCMFGSAAGRPQGAHDMDDVTFRGKPLHAPGPYGAAAGSRP